MSPADVSLVQSSFRQVAPIAEQAAALFYARLFEIDPALRSLFTGDMHQQGRKLMTMLAMVVSSLDQPDKLLPMVRDAGVRHSSYGALEEHYASVGAALMWTLQKGLGPDFTPAVSGAWTQAYTLLATTMIEAQRSARVAA